MRNRGDIRVGQSECRREAHATGLNNRFEVEAYRDNRFDAGVAPTSQKMVEFWAGVG